MGKTWKTSIDNLEKQGDFLPSIALNAPDNDWQMASGGDNLEIPVDPDAQSDEVTDYAPCTTGKPRSKNMWREFMSIFRNPFSKKEDMTVDSAYDPKLEQEEKDALGEDETLLEYSKGFYDPKKHDFPHNTTWDSLTQDGEPSKPTSVTYSPQISNEDNLDQNSPGGFPRRFMGKPKGEWFSNEGEVTEFLVNMIHNRDACLDSMTRDITADLTEKGYWIDPSGTFYPVRTEGGWKTHGEWVWVNRPMLKEMYPDLPETKEPWDLISFLFGKGWTRIGDSFGADYGIETKDPYSLPSSVLDWINTSNLKAVKIEIFPSHVGATIELPVDNLQEAVDNEFSRSRLAPVAKQASFNAGGWISPDGQYIETNDHFGYVSTHLDAFGLSQLKSIQTKFERDSAVVRAMQYIFERGWIRVRDWGGTLMIQGNNFQNIKAHAEDFIYNNLDDAKKIRIETDDEQAYTCTTEEFKQDGWNAFLKQPVMAKQASIEDLDGLTLFVNPTEQELKGFSNKLRGGHMFRGLLDPHTGDLYVWDAYEAIHQYVIQKLGLHIKYSDESPYCLYFPSSDIYDTLARQQEVKQGKQLQEPIIAKQAGSQSASVPDYLCDEWKTEQIHNDTDEEPYVNHDQRDYPYGMHDSPENTGYNIGWPKDNQPSVVHLDTLEDPAYRLDPFGIGEYWVTWYESLPASDGIEKMNP